MIPHPLPIERPDKPLEVVTSIDDYAFVVAHVSRYRYTFEVLAALGVSKADWSLAQIWCERLAGGLIEGEQALASRFAASFSAALQELPPTDAPAAALAAPNADTPVPSSLPSSFVAAASDAAAKSVRDQEARQAAEAVVFRHKPEAPVPPSKRAEDLDMTTEMRIPESRPAIPFDPGATPTLVPTPPSRRAPQVRPAEDDLDATSEIRIESLSRPLPFETPQITMDEYVLLYAGMAPPALLDKMREPGVAERTQAHFKALFEKDPNAVEQFKQSHAELKSRKG